MRDLRSFLECFSPIILATFFHFRIGKRMNMGNAVEIEKLRFFPPLIVYYTNTNSHLTSHGHFSRSSIDRKPEIAIADIREAVKINGLAICILRVESLERRVSRRKRNYTIDELLSEFV